MALDMYLPIICEAAGRPDTSGPGFLGGHRANEDGLLWSHRGSLVSSYANRLLVVYTIQCTWLLDWFGDGNSRDAFMVRESGIHLFGAT